MAHTCTPGYSDLVLGGQVPRLHHDQFDSKSKTLKEVLGSIESQVPIFGHFHGGLSGTYYWGIASRICL